MNSDNELLGGESVEMMEDQASTQRVSTRSISYSELFNGIGMHPEVMKTWSDTFDANNASVEERMRTRESVLWMFEHLDEATPLQRAHIGRGLALAAVARMRTQLLRTSCSHCGMVIRRQTSGLAIEQQADTTFFCTVKCANQNRMSGFKRLTEPLRGRITAEYAGGLTLREVAVALNVSPQGVEGYLQAKAIKDDSVRYEPVARPVKGAVPLMMFEDPLAKKPREKGLTASAYTDRGKKRKYTQR